MTDPIHSDAERRATAWLKAWDGQGIHRTGTAGDEAGAAWLLSAASAMGASPVQETFAIRRLDPIEAVLEIDGQPIAGVPVFDAPATRPEGISGVLGPDAPIKLAELSPWAVYQQSYRELRQKDDHQALVILCQGNEAGLGLLNAEQFLSPFGKPAIHLDSAAGPVVHAAIGRPVRFVSHSRRTTVDACNVVVSLPGRDRSRRPVVVMTPRSSWWQSTSERGGGLVCWLETLRALLAEPPACDVVLTANTGHELGHLGLDEFLRRRPGWDGPDGPTWVHYGANIGATDSTLSLPSNTPDLRGIMQNELRRQALPAATEPPAIHVPSGETRDIHRAGGHYLTLVGSNRLFHVPQDRWPDAVDVGAVARTAAAAARMVVAITR